MTEPEAVIKFECPACGQRLEAPVDMAGEIISCPAEDCNKPIRVPLQLPIKSGNKVMTQSEVMREALTENLKLQRKSDPKAVIKFECPHCGKHIEAPIEMAGKTVQCPNDECGKQIQIASATQAPEIASLTTGPQVRPWIRYWARMIDFTLFAVVVAFVAGLLYPLALHIDNVSLTIILFFAYVFVEALMLSSWGSTPGKALLKVRLRKTSGEKPSYYEALARSLNVWLRGMGLGIPLISLFTMVTAYKKLLREKTTTWDQVTGFRVTHETIGTLRGTVAVIFLVCIIGFRALDSSIGVKLGTSSGTGWICQGGYIVSCYHVVTGRSAITVVSQNIQKTPVEVVLKDEANDLVLLRAKGGVLDLPGIPLAAEPASLGEKVFTIGFPHIGLMGQQPKLTDGVISSRTGMQDDPKVYQISVPVQSGNSGGPLINERGEVIGVVASKLQAETVFKWTGDLPQNVNYAIKVSYLKSLIETLSNVAGGSVLPSGQDSMPNIARRVQNSVVLILAE